MDYHEGFWITVTAAAPVLALTYVVTMQSANRLDHEITDIGIWGDWRAKRILLTSLAGFVTSAISFVWGVLGLVARRDVGHLATPTVLLLTSFLAFLALAVMEVRAYSWLKESRYQIQLAKSLAIFPQPLRDLGSFTGNAEVYWPLAEAPAAIDALEASGFVITGINVRHDRPDGSWIMVPLRRYGFETPEEASDAAAEDLSAFAAGGLGAYTPSDIRDLPPGEVTVEILWSQR